MSMNEEQATELEEQTRIAAAALAGLVDYHGSGWARIPVAIGGANYVVTVNKMEAPLNES